MARVISSSLSLLYPIYVREDNKIRFPTFQFKTSPIKLYLNFLLSKAIFLFSHKAKLFRLAQLKHFTESSDSFKFSSFNPKKNPENVQLQQVVSRFGLRLTWNRSETSWRMIGSWKCLLCLWLCAIETPPISVVSVLCVWNLMPLSPSSLRLETTRTCFSRRRMRLNKSGIGLLDE